FPTLLENLTEVFIAPPKLARDKGMKALATAPVGTGPYKFSSWKKDQEIILVKNDDYWKGKPAIDKIVFRVIPEVGPRIAALVAGEVDLVPDVPPHLINQVKASGKATVKSVAGRRPIFIAFDTINKGPGDQSP
ncbi:MAG: ABC transporter substrate-binding protein, partial [Firmicutes bacterium]|nr:ABC transporter substrate-binding protein [Bacillota bacterium]